MGGTEVKNKDSGEGLAIGCFALYVVFALAWICFLVWAIYSVVSWLVTK